MAVSAAAVFRLLASALPMWLEISAGHSHNSVARRSSSMKRTFAILPLVLILAAATRSLAAEEQGKPAARTSTGAASNPTLDQVLDKYVQALGGKEAIERVTSRIMTGSIESPATGDAGHSSPARSRWTRRPPTSAPWRSTFPATAGS